MPLCCGPVVRAAKQQLGLESSSTSVTGFAFLPPFPP